VLRSEAQNFRVAFTANYGYFPAMASDESKDKAFWETRARKLSRRINTAWFLQVLAAPLLVTAVAGAVATLVIRREFAEITPLSIGLVILGILLVLAATVLFIAWKRFERPEQSLVRIEAAQRMDSSLSAASAGVRAWPEPPPNLSKSLSWHLPKTIAPPLAALAVLALGLLVPINAKSGITPPPSRQPQAWSEIDSQLEKLAEDAMVDEEYIEEMEKRLEQLRSQEEQDWFSHASLEATDSLKVSQNSNIEDLQRDLSEAGKALEALAENAGKLDSAQKQKLTEEFEKALQGLQNGAMKPNPGLLDKLSELDPDNLGKLSPDQLFQLKENMEKLQQSLENAGGEQGQGDDWSDQLLGDQGECPNGTCKDGTCPGGGDCPGHGEGEGPGKGGIDRGPGHDPNVLRGEKDPLGAGELTSLQTKDLSRAIPGDLLQLQDGKHTVDETASSASAGGAAAAGQGGDRVWKESLAPDEQRALKKYFE